MGLLSEVTGVLSELDRKGPLVQDSEVPGNCSSLLASASPAQFLAALQNASTAQRLGYTATSVYEG
jgi:hypothetical protein